MKNFDKINRRTHLYLGMFLFPWFFMYGFSSLIISHHSWFRSEEQLPWTVIFDKEYEFPIHDESEVDLRQIAKAILIDNEYNGAFRANRTNDGKITINQFSFWTINRFTYFPEQKRLLAENQKLRWDQIILRMHFRANYIQESFLNDLWAFVLDMVCLSILIWLASGIYMWWKLRKLRLWGTIALGGGFVSFLLLLLNL